MDSSWQHTHINTHTLIARWINDLSCKLLKRFNGIYAKLNMKFCNENVYRGKKNYTFPQVLLQNPMSVYYINFWRNLIEYVIKTVGYLYKISCFVTKVSQI